MSSTAGTLASGRLTVGEAARRADVSAKAVRLYEAKGLLSAAPRTASGYRSFSEADVRVLLFIRRARSLGLALAEIGAILDLQRQGTQPCARVLALLDRHRAAIDARLAELRSLRTSLTRVRAAAGRSARRGGQAVVCRIIERSS